MDRTHPALRPRRLVVAALLALAVTASLGAAVALQQPAPGLRLDRVEVPAAHVGDRGRYALTLTGEWRYDEHQAGVPFPGLDYAVRHAVPSLDSWGRQRMADPIEMQGPAYAPLSQEYSDGAWRQGDAWIPSNETAYLEANGDAVLAAGVAGSGVVVKNLTSTPAPLVRTASFALDVLEFQRAEDPWRLCVVGEAWAGTWDRATERRLPACNLDRLTHARAGTFTFDGNETVRGVPTLRYTLRDDPWDGNVTIWLASGLPVPVRYEATQTTWLDSDFTRGVGTFRLELVAFERGAVPRSTPTDVGPQPPAWTLAPRQPWGPDDAGVDGTFPARLAYEKAQESPALAAFLAAAPDAYVAGAGLGGTVEPNERDRSWHFTFANGTHYLTVVVREKARVAAPADAVAALLLPQVPEALMGKEYEVEDGRVVASPAYPLPGAVPAMLPTVASLLDRHTLFTGATASSPDEVSWSFVLLCGGSCDEAIAYYHVGVERLDRRPVAPDSTPPARLLGMDFASSSTMFLEDGQATFTAAASTRMSSQAGPLAPPATPPREAAAPPEPLGAAAFALPPVAAATVSLVGVLAGLLYFFWPALKAGGLGLFSRVQRADLLDNPVRATLHQAIEAQPGVHQQDLVRLVGKGNGTVEHHLRKLVAGGLVVRAAGPGYTCYFLKGAADRHAMAAAPLLKSPVAQAIVEAARSRPGVPPSVLARELGVAPPTISYHLRRLEAAGLVRMEDGLRAAA